MALSARCKIGRPTKFFKSSSLIGLIPFWMSSNVSHTFSFITLKKFFSLIWQNESSHSVWGLAFFILQKQREMICTIFKSKISTIIKIQISTYLQRFSSPPATTCKLKERKIRTFFIRKVLRGFVYQLHINLIIWENIRSSIFLIKSTIV